MEEVKKGGKKERRKEGKRKEKGKSDKITRSEFLSLFFFLSISHTLFSCDCDSSGSGGDSVA